ncbi:MAG: PRC-barrel domain-containing protein [Deltaproteobacteria bacterium]|nr:PRC-barrel domain-containing protein [Deltaproteobacteria bacterium]
MSLGWVASATYRDRKVENPWGEHLGRIKGAVGDPASGRVVYVVVTHGGFLGLGAKWFAVPQDALKPTFDDLRAFLAVDRSTLDRLPGFDKRHLPEAADPRLVRELLEPTVAPP